MLNIHEYTYLVILGGIIHGLRDISKERTIQINCVRKVQTVEQFSKTLNPIPVRIKFNTDNTQQQTEL